MVPPSPSSGVARLGRFQSARWSLTLFPSAGEAGGSFVPAPRRGGGQRGTRGAAADPERSRIESAHRARAKVRRYCAANDLDHLGTLTYGPPGCGDARVMRAHLSEFFRDLRAALGGKPLPYLWVPERHKSGLLHAHCAVGRYIRKSQLANVWGRGFVKMTYLKDMPVGSTKKDVARRAAGYLSKYVSKTFDSSSAGLHRYEVAQGFQPRSVTLTGRTAADVLEQACDVMRAEPTVRWSSLDAPDWQGPPAVWFAWA